MCTAAWVGAFAFTCASFAADRGAGGDSVTPDTPLPGRLQERTLQVNITVNGNASDGAGITMEAEIGNGRGVKETVLIDGTREFRKVPGKVTLDVTTPELSGKVGLYLPDVDLANAIVNIDLHTGRITAQVLTPELGRIRVGTAAGEAAGSDSCDTATFINGAGTFQFDNTNASADGQDHFPGCEEFGSGEVDNDVWFLWTSDCQGEVTFGTCDGQTGVDTKVAVYSTGGTCPPGDAALLGCNDDSCGFQSAVTFNANPGDQYLFRIGTFPGALGGTGTFTVDGEQCGVTGPVGTGADDCGSADAIADAGTFAFDNSAATIDGVNDPLCESFGVEDIDNDIWFLWTSNCDGDVTLSLCAAGATDVDTKVAVYAAGACPTGGGILDCNDDTCGFQSEVAWAALEGGEYLIRIGTFPGSLGGTGEFTISGANCGDGGGGGGDCDAPSQDGNGGDSSGMPSNASGAGDFAFDNGAATEDGPAHPECLAFGADTIDSDVWFCWTAPIDGDYTLQTCGLTGVDTKIAVYDGCGAPMQGNLLACNDDTCGLQSLVTFAATGGSTYMLRIGTFPGAAGGPGSFNLTTPACEGGGGGDEPCNCCSGDLGAPGCDDAECEAIVCDPVTGDPFCCDVQWDPLCSDQAVIAGCECCDDGGPGGGDPADCGDTLAGGCQLPDQLGHGAGGTIGATSDANPGAGFAVADTFQAAETGNVNAVCFWGIYVDFNLLVDCAPGTGSDFSITYFSDDAGGAVPGSLYAGPFNVGDADGGPDGLSIATGIGPIAEYQFHGTHADVAVTSGTCYWIQIQDNTTGTCFFLWSTAPGGDNHGAQDGAATDYDMAFCVNIDTNPEGCGTIDFCEGAVGDCCEPNGTPGCENSECCNIVCAADSFCCDTEWDGICSGQAEDLCGDFCGGGVAPANDNCDNAIGVAIGSNTIGTTDGATADANAFDCGTSVTAPGVWYTVVGNGQNITASFCPAVADSDCCSANGTPGCSDAQCEADVCAADSFCCDTEWDGLCAGIAADLCADLCAASGGGAADYDSKLSVYCGTCSALECVDGNDDSCGLASEVTWCSQSGATYYVLVHGFGGATGNFDLGVSTSAGSCTPDVSCVVQGACCIPGADCIVTDADTCAANGGDYQGDDVACETPAETVGPQSNPNAPLPDGDPAGISDTVIMGMSFTVLDVNINLAVDHTWVGDLCATVEHRGVEVALVLRMGADTGEACHADGPFGCGNDNIDITLDDQAGDTAEAACAAGLSGSFQPNGLLSDFNGLDSAGPWTITISDNAAADTGTLVSWGLEFAAGEPTPICVDDTCDEGIVCSAEMVGGGEDGSAASAGSGASGNRTDIVVGWEGCPATGSIDIGCDIIAVENGTLVNLTCLAADDASSASSGSGSGAEGPVCDWFYDMDGVLHITSSQATLSVIADTGDVECTLDLCASDDDDASSASSASAGEAIVGPADNGVSRADRNGRLNRAGLRR